MRVVVFARNQVFPAIVFSAVSFFLVSFFQSASFFFLNNLVCLSAFFAHWQSWSPGWFHWQWFFWLWRLARKRVIISAGFLAGLSSQQGLEHSAPKTFFSSGCFFRQPCGLTKRALDGWFCGDLQAFFWLRVFSTSQTLSTPTHLRVTQTVGHLAMWSSKENLAGVCLAHIFFFRVSLSSRRSRLACNQFCFSWFLLAFIFWLFRLAGFESRLVFLWLAFLLCKFLFCKNVGF